MLKQTSEIAVQTIKTKLLPSQILNRFEEHYNSVLAEDLAILSYDHARHGNHNSPYRRIIKLENEALNAQFNQTTRALRLKQLQELTPIHKIKKSAKSDATAGLNCVPSAQQILSSYLDPITGSSKNRADTEGTAVDSLQMPIFENLPRICSVTVKMKMPAAITSSKKVLMHGMLALNLCTGQQSQILHATKHDMDGKLRIRDGIPFGVGVTMHDPRVIGNFLGKFVEVVLPKLRDFNGFSKATGSYGNWAPRSKQERECLSIITLRMSAESWQAFPEISQSYLKFPAMNSTGSLQDYEVQIQCWGVRSHEQARMLLSGYRIPFTFLEPEPVVELQEHEEDDIHEV